jgi:hypothetical protein
VLASALCNQRRGLTAILPDSGCQMTDTPDSMPVTGEVVDESFAGKGEWLAPPLAAIRLDISERTLWRRVDAGKLRKRIVSGRAQVYVPLSGAAPATEESRENTEETSEIAHVTPDRQSDVLALALIQEFQARREKDAATITSLTETVTRQAEEIGRLTGELNETRLPLRKRLKRWLTGE